MSKIVAALKTSEQWLNDQYASQVTILEKSGWTLGPWFTYSFYNELINEQEFLRRLTSSKIEWKVEKL